MEPTAPIAARSGAIRLPPATAEGVVTFASRMQHRIYGGGLKSWIEWSLKTWLAPWAYIASVVYHDMFWYPFLGKRPLRKVLRSEWGQLFSN
jgi:hypothetical protein